MKRCRVFPVSLALALAFSGLATLHADQTEDIYISASGSGMAGSVPFDDEDIVRCDRSGGVGTCQWTMFFDGSAYGVPGQVDLSAYVVLDDNNLLLSFRTPIKLAGLGKVDDSDIVRFNRLAAANNRFTFYFDGSDVGLTMDDERLDSIAVDATGRLIISTEGNYSVPRTGGGVLTGTDSDLIVFNGTLNGAQTSGNWALFLDGSEAGLNSPQEDVWGAWVDHNTDEVYLTTRGDYSIGGLNGTGTDIFICDPADQNPITACENVYLFFRAAQEDYSDRIIDGIFIFNNAPPDAVDDEFNTDEDTPLNGNVLANDTDPDGDPLTVSRVNGVASDVGVEITLTSGARLTLGADGAFSYDPTGAFDYLAPGESAEDDFSYTVQDGNGGSDSATVTVTVAGVEDLPVAVDDTANVQEDASATPIDVLANDTDVDGGPISVASVDTTGTNGAVTIAAMGVSVSYTPDPNYCNDDAPPDTFTYTLNGGSTATVQVDVACINDPPDAVDDLVTTSEDDPTTGDVLLNDADPDADLIAVTSVDGSAANVGMAFALPGGGLLTVDADGTLSFDPDDQYEELAPGEFIDETVQYVISDGLLSDAAIITITITGVDDTPTAVDDMATVDEDSGATTIDVLANDTDPEGDAISVASVTQPAGGAVVNNGSDVSYTPDPDYCNDGTPTDDFTYTVNGGSSATVSVTVVCLPDPPVVVAPGPFDVIGNVRIQVPDGASDLMSDVTGDGPFSVDSFDAVSANGGNVSVTAATGAFTYNPPAGFEGADTFGYEVCGAGGCTPATVTLDVAGMIWFVDASAAGGGDGRLTAPFNCLTGAGCFDPAAADGAGDNIFLADGAYLGGLTLLNNQRLIGDGSSSTLAGITGLTVPTFSDALPSFSGVDPTITSGANGVNLAMGNTVRGLTIGDNGGTGLNGTAVGNLAVSEVTLGDASPAGGGFEVSTSGVLNVSLDALSANSAAQEGIRLIGVSGSFSIVATGGSIQTTNVPAVVIDGNPSLAISMTFQRVSANGGANGIALTDTTGSFAVTGTGTAGSGGAILNTTGANATNAGIGVFLSNAQGVSLSRMQINDHQNFAIRGTGVNGFTLADSVVSGVNGNSAADDEGSIAFTNLTGTANFSGSSISGGFEDNLRVDNSTGSLTLNLQDSAANPMVIGLNAAASGVDALRLVTTGDAVATLSVNGVEFLGAREDMIQTVAVGTSAHDITIQNSAFHNTHSNIVTGGGGITLTGGSITSDILVAYDVLNNVFSGAEGNAITANFLSNAGAVTGLIQNNTIGTATAGSGSTDGSGILAGAEKEGANPGAITHTVRIEGNTIRSVNGFAGIDIVSNRGPNAADRAVVNATVVNNNVFGLGGFVLTGLNLIVGGSGDPADFSFLCADVRNNSINASGAADGDNAVLFDQIGSNARHNLPGYAGSPNGEFAPAPGTASFDINAYLAAQGNTLVNGAFPQFPTLGVNAAQVVGVGGVGTTCP